VCLFMRTQEKISVLVHAYTGEGDSVSKPLGIKVHLRLSQPVSEKVCK
jgi:hypothetical protein